MMAATLTLSMFEIILLFFGAIILGITIHFFISSRKNLNETKEEIGMTNVARDEWKLRYFNDMEARDKELSVLKERLQESEENTNIYTMEADEMRRQNKLLKTELENTQQHFAAQTSAWKAESINRPAAEPDDAEDDVLMNRIEELEQRITELKAELETARKTPIHQPEMTRGEKPDYLEQLRQAQHSLLEHNQKINQLLGNIDIIKEKEEKEREILRDNEELYGQLDTLRDQLQEKEREIQSIKEKEHLTREMTSMLDNAYREFNVLQDKMQKMESQLTSSKRMNMEMEDLREEHTKLSRDMDEQRQRLHRMQAENQDLRTQLMQAEDNLRETSFQKQQLQKRVAYLEELNNDLQVVSDANKKLESQLRRVGELESKLNVVSEERDHLIRHQEEK